MAKVNCPQCGARTDFPEDPSLKRGKCEYCEHVFDLPELVPPLPMYARRVEPALRPRKGARLP